MPTVLRYAFVGAVSGGEPDGTWGGWDWAAPQNVNVFLQLGKRKSRDSHS
jgi:hypothetical protein